jgi:hypothetical protein
MKIKFGGSGNISTKNLEDATDLIIRARTLRSSATVDSNFITSLIQEVLRERKAKFDNEFILDEEHEEDDDAVELRRPIIPVKRKRVRVSTKTYWMDTLEARVAVGILLLFLIIIPIIVFLA